MEGPGHITQLLKRWTDGDADAAEELIPLVYDELRRTAHAYLNRERAAVTLDPTGLVHEAYLRMVTPRNLTFESRTQFFGFAAKLMRNVLVDRAREHAALKRGGDQMRISLSQVDRFLGQKDVDLTALNDALKRLAELNPRHAELVELRFFGGLTIEEIASVQGVSHATVERQWRFIRAWLFRDISNSQPDADGAAPLLQS